MFDMLRIALPTAARPGVFVLEGKLTGLWAKELVRVARQTKEVCGGIFDLQEVSPVDSGGEQALRILNGFGAKFIVESPYGKGLCKRLKLHRVSASKVESDKQEADAPRATADDRREHGAKLVSFTSQPHINTARDTGE